MTCHRPPLQHEAHYWRLAGALTGLIAASRWKGHLSLRGWQRMAASVCIGTAAGELGSSASTTLQSRLHRDDPRKDRAVLHENRESFSKLWEAVLTGGYSLQRQAIPLNDHDEHRTPPRPRPDPNSLARAPVSPEDIVKQLPTQFQQIAVLRVDATSGPHVLVSEPGTTELKPAPHTNYAWAPRPGAAIPELKNHIEALQAYRAKLATEATTIWHWLGEQEARYYALKDSDNAVGYDVERAKEKLRAYCEELSSEHLTLWVALSKIDWIIADSQKRIGQQERFIKGDYRAQCPSTALQESSLAFFLDRAQSKVQAYETQDESHDKTIATLERALKDGKLSDLPEPLRSALKNAPNRKQLLDSLIEDGKRTKEDGAKHKTAAEEILQDGKKKASSVLKD